MILRLTVSSHITNNTKLFSFCTELRLSHLLALVAQTTIIVNNRIFYVFFLYTIAEEEKNMCIIEYLYLYIVKKSLCNYDVSVGALVVAADCCA